MSFHGLLPFPPVSGPALQGDDLARVEALTIWWHSPAYNSLSKQYQQRAKTEPRLLVQTQGARGKLAIEYSDAWDRTWDRDPG